MANKRHIDEGARPATKANRVPIVLGATNGEEDAFSVHSYFLNKTPDGGIVGPDENKYTFPGNISPEGYFYAPFYEVTLKELDDELQYVDVRRINFNPTSASVSRRDIDVYNPNDGSTSSATLYDIKLVAPVPYDLIIGQPFSIYDIEKEMTYRAYLSDFSGRNLTVTTKEAISPVGLTGNKPGLNGKSQYIISYLSDNAPEYAEFIPSSQRLVWRGPKKMSDLESTSSIYDMPFANGRNYIHKNIDVFVRRQDPHGEYKLFRPSQNNPLRRFQIEGESKLDFDYIQEIIDSMVDAC